MNICFGLVNTSLLETRSVREILSSIKQNISTLIQKRVGLVNTCLGVIASIYKSNKLATKLRPSKKYIQIDKKN